jgi:hypothetical protein
MSLNKPTIQNVRLGRNGRVAVRAMRPATSSSAEPNTRVLSDHQRRPRRVRAARLDSDQDRAKVQPGTEGGWAIAALHYVVRTGKECSAASATCAKDRAVDCLRPRLGNVPRGNHSFSRG